MVKHDNATPGRERDDHLSDMAEKANDRDGRAIVQQLFSRKARTSALSKEQLRPLFPKSDGESFSRSIRITDSSREKNPFLAGKPS